MNRNEKVYYTPKMSLKNEINGQKKRKRGSRGLGLELCFGGKASREKEDLGTPSHKRLHSRVQL